MPNASDPANSTYNPPVPVNTNDNCSLLDQLDDEYEPNTLAFVASGYTVAVMGMDAVLVKPWITARST